MSSTIIDCAEALCLVGEKVKNLRHEGKGDQLHFLNFHGVAGIGKTMVLHHLATYYGAHHEDCFPLSKGSCGEFGIQPCGEAHEALPCAYIDCSRGEYSDPQAAHVKLLEDIVIETSKAVSIVPRLQEKVDTFLEQAANFRQEASMLQSSETQFQSTAEAMPVVDRFLAVIRNILEYRPPGSYPMILLMLLDSVDKAPSQWYSWLETEIMDHLRPDDRCMVILTSDKPLNWQHVSGLSQYTERRQLKPFLFKDTREQLPTDLSNVVAKVHALTGGHPDANHHVLQKWQGEPDKTVEPGRWINDNGREISKALAEKIVYNRILQSDDTKLRDAFLKTSVVRWLECSMCTSLLRTNCSPTFASLTAYKCMEMLTNMKETDYFSWDGKKKGWVMEPAIRRILAAYLRWNDSMAYKKLSQVALDQYEQWIPDYPDDCHLFVVECLYHKACLLTFDDLSPQVLADKLGVFFDEGLTMRGDINQERLISLLRDDPELQEMLGNELENMIKPIQESIVRRVGH